MRVIEHLNLTLLSQAPSSYTRLANLSKTCLPAASCITILMSVKPLDALLSGRCACSDRFIAEQRIASFPRGTASVEVSAWQSPQTERSRVGSVGRLVPEICLLRPSSLRI